MGLFKLITNMFSSKKEESPVVEKLEQNCVSKKEETWFKGVEYNPYTDNTCEVPVSAKKVEEPTKTKQVEKVVERLVEVSAKEIKAKAKKTPKEEVTKATKAPAKKRVPKK